MVICRTRPDTAEGQRDELEIKVIDFDWAGKLGSAKYPVIVDPQIKWAGAPGDVIGEDDDETVDVQWSIWTKN